MYSVFVKKSPAIADVSHLNSRAESFNNVFKISITNTFRMKEQWSKYFLHAEERIIITFDDL